MKPYFKIKVNMNTYYFIAGINLVFKISIKCYKYYLTNNMNYNNYCPLIAIVYIHVTMCSEF